ncbi:MAG TPA: hypothetical protein VIJ34_09095, partial [Acidimicrobiales bacterium]
MSVYSPLARPPAERAGCGGRPAWPVSRQRARSGRCVMIAYRRAVLLVTDLRHFDGVELDP